MKTNLPFGHPAWVEIDLGQLKKNIAIIRQHIGKRLLCFPVKANAYGHGLITISRAAVEAGVDYFAVSSLQEGALLRKAGITLPILVLGAIHEEQISGLLDYQLEFTIASRFKADLVAKKCCEFQKKCRVHVEVETGMQRTGVRPQTALDLLEYLHSQPIFEVVGLYSHLATADIAGSDVAVKQIELFKNFVNQYYTKINPNHPVICHIANSGGVCYFPESLMDMVRPGLLIFGYFPNPIQESFKKIAPFFSVKAKIAYFKVTAAQQGVSYGHTYITAKETRIVTVPVGYGDGLRRELSNRGHVLIRGRRYPIVGMICMDQLMVDIGRDEAYVGDEVTLIGHQGNESITLNEVAQLCDTIPYEILCGFNDRLPRFYIEPTLG